MSEERKILDLSAAEAIRDWVKDNFITKNDLLNLGLVSQLYVTFDEDFVGQTYSIVGGDKTYSGVVPENGEVLLLVNTPNTAYIVTCPNDEGTECTCEIQVGSQNGRYAGKLACFEAYLHVQAEAGATVTATVGDYSYTGTAGEDGYCTLTVKRKGTYSVTAKLGIRASDAVTADVSESGATVEVACGELKTKIVNWSDGSDEEVAAMIDAAHAGEIDLQTDMGWKVGDTRTIHIDAFTGGGDVSHEEQDIDIVISSFENYEGCGCKMQFDFKQALARGHKMNSSATNAGGYKASEMYTATLPALVEAVPEWLKERLVEFSVKASVGNQSSTIETITGNKLALRSEIEIFGFTSTSEDGEGTQIEYYKTAKNRKKTWGKDGSAAYWSERSPNKEYSTHFCLVDSYGYAYTGNGGYASNSYGIAPFGCL